MQTDCIPIKSRKSILGDHRVNTLTVDWGDETTSVYACDGEDNAGGPYTHVYATDGGYEPSLTATAFKDDFGIEGTAGIVDVLKPTLSISADGNATADESGQQPAILEITRTGTDLLTPLAFDITSGGSLADQLDPHDVEGGRAFALVESDGELQEAGQEMTIPVGQVTEMLYVYPLEDHTPRWTETVDVTLSEATDGEDYTLASASPGSPPDTAAGVYVESDDLYGWLGNGSDNDIFEGGTPADGGTLVPLVLDLPEEVRNGAEITLTDNAPTEADVYTTSDPGDTDTPILGDVSGTTVSEVTWTQGIDDAAPSGQTTLWVEGINGSASLNDISFEIYDSDAGCGADGTASDPTLPQYDGDGVTPTYATTTVSGPTNAAADVWLEIISRNDPNPGEPTGRVEGKSRDWLVGQLADLEAEAAGPVGMILDPNTIRWTVPPGNVLYKYVIDGNAGKTFSLAANEATAGAGPLSSNVGTSEPEVQFFWVSAGSGGTSQTEQVSVSANLIDGEPLGASTKFNVFSPTVSSPTKASTASLSVGTAPAITSGATTKLGLEGGVADPNNVQLGMMARATVTVPSGFAVGTFNFLQLVKHEDTKGLKTGQTLVSTDDPTKFLVDLTWPVNEALRYLTGGTPYHGDAFDAPNSLGWKTGESHWFTDAPSMPLGPDVVSASMNNAFVDYLMFLPPGSDSQWVALETAQWGFSAVADMSKTPPSLTSFAAYGNRPQDQFLATTQEPQWTGASRPGF